MAIQKSKITFLITYFAHPELMKICLDSIRKHHPDDPIIVSRQVEDAPIDFGDAKVIEHDMRKAMWAEVAQGLMRECETDVAVFVEHDAFILRNIQDMIDKIGDEYDLIGPEEVMHIRNSPGMMCQNFFIINVKKMKEIGLDKVWVRDVPKLKELHPGRNVESGHGISQSFEKKLFLPVIESGYAFGTYYGDVAHHLWFGSYKKRNTMIDNVSPLYMEEETQRLIKDYWDKNIKYEIRSSNDSV